MIRRLSIPLGSRESVKNTMRASLCSIQENLEFDACLGSSVRGKKALIEDFSDEAHIVYNSITSGIGIYSATVLLNEYRLSLEKSPISCSSVERFSLRSTVINKSKRLQQKSGKDDGGTPWASARLNQCLEWKSRIEAGYGGGDLPGMNYEDNLKPIHLDGIAWYDENHKKVILGFTSKIEHRIRRHPITGLPCTKEDGGVLPPKKSQTAVKFPGEARGMFGAAMRTNANGTVEGVKAAPFFYTDRFVLGLKEYKVKMQEELDRVKILKGSWGRHGEGYLERYEENWDLELRKSIDKKYCCVTDMMDHAIAESTKIFAGTLRADDFLIFHDGLSQWWEVEAQQYLADKNFADRQLRCEGDANKEFKRNHHKVVGDSPELCSALDAHGFADFKACIFYHLSGTSGQSPTTL